jgi:zearalenone synthase (nonreducing iterative type I polyketide synthase)
MMSDMGLETQMAAGFMKNPKLGPIAWSMPGKSKDDLGFNGWDTFLGDDIKILVVDADHLSLPVPPDVSCPLGLLETYEINIYCRYSN